MKELFMNKSNKVETCPCGMSKSSEERLIRKQRKVIDAGPKLSSAINLDDLLDEISREATKVVDADRSSIYLVDKEKNEIWTKVAIGLKDRLRFSINKGISGYVARTGEILNIDDPYSHSMFNKEIDKSTGYTTKSLLTVPMKNMRGEILGAIQALNQIYDEPFSEIDEALLTSLASLAAAAVDNSQLYFELQNSYRQTLQSLVSLLDLRDNSTERHSIRVVKFTMRLAEETGITDRDELQIIEWGAMLHDVGKIGVPDSILQKPGPLTDEEWKIMETHPELGYQALKDIPFLKKAAFIVRHHQEKYDGTGYPAGLKEEEIPLGARIFAAADTYDAMSSDRVYRKALPYEVIVEEFKKCSSTQFDPKVVEAFLNVTRKEWQDIKEEIEAMDLSTFMISAFPEGSKT